MTIWRKRRTVRRFAERSLPSLIEQYTKDLSPFVYSKKFGGDVPVWKQYDFVMGRIQKAVDEGDLKAIEYRRKLFGEDIIEFANPEYFEISYYEGKYTPQEWRDMCDHDKAKLLAKARLSSMVQTLERDKEIQRDLAEKNAAKANGKN